MYTAFDVCDLDAESIDHERSSFCTSSGQTVTKAMACQKVKGRALDLQTPVNINSRMSALLPLSTTSQKKSLTRG